MRGRPMTAGAALIATIAMGCTATAPAPTSTPMPMAPSASDRASASAIPTSSGGSSAAAASAPSEPVPESPGLDEVFAAMLETIVTDRPTVRFDLQPDRLDGTWILDGNADDGLGPARLYVTVTPRPGDLTAHPCGDPDFRQGGSCVEQSLPNGDRLVLRDRVTGGGVTTVLAVLIHPDRSGISAESSNMLIDLSSGPIGPGPRDPPAVTRAEPLYTARELGALLVAIGRRLAGLGLAAS
jgi:hypothetical protein